MKQYFMPTKVFDGRGCVKANQEAFATLGKRALIVTGVHSAVASGALADVLDVLSANGQSSVLYNKVMNNPTVPCVYEGGKLARKEKADFVVAIGGGSPMDAAKVMAILACQNIREEDIFSGNYGGEALPIIAIPTTSGTGSEVTPYAVLTNDQLKTKTSVATPLIFPVFAFLDGGYTDKLKQDITVDTAIDALSHSMEGYLSVKAGRITDALAEQSMRYIGQVWDTMETGDYQPEDRDRLMMASTMAGMVIATTGTTLVHAMGYPLTYFHDIPHGRANALLLGAYLRWMEEVFPEKVKTILTCLNFPTVDSFAKAVDLLLGEKESIPAEKLTSYAKDIAKSPKLSNGLAIPDEATVEKIYLEAFSK